MEFSSIIEEFVSEVAGKDAIKILNILKEQNNVSEFDIAEKLKMSINQIRNLLYKLNSHNLVYSNRKKDRDKGWYIYYWTFNFRHAKDLLINIKQKEMDHLKDELKKESEHRFFVCPVEGIRVEFEEALENEYKCSECGSVLKQEESTKRINEIEIRMSKLNSEIQELNKPSTITPHEAEEEKPKIAKKTAKKKLKKIKKKKAIKKFRKPNHKTKKVFRKKFNRFKKKKKR